MKSQATEPMHAAPRSAKSPTTEPMHAPPKSAAKAPIAESPKSAPANPGDRIGVSTDGRRAPVVHVVGFWKRAIAACVDLAIVIPTAMLVTFLASKVSGVRLPSEKLRLLDIDLWIDLVLATDPAIVMGIVLFVAVGLTYLFVFHLLQGRTLGMRLMKMRVIDVYGDRPSPARCAARCAGYLAGVATLFLGFLWMGFDSEKRGLQDWLAGTYVIRG
ncbi:MAG: RDD family protein [Deltaproteobacteria bacterium]|nr:RDD family protein [Deltaproteobacteria bacterium]